MEDSIFEQRERLGFGLGQSSYFQGDEVTLDSSGRPTSDAIRALQRLEMEGHQRRRAEEKVAAVYKENIADKLAREERITERDLEKMKLDFKDADPANYAAQSQSQYFKEALVARVESTLHYLNEKASEATPKDFERFAEDLAQAKEQGAVTDIDAAHYTKQAETLETFYEAERFQALDGNSLERPGAYPEAPDSVHRPADPTDSDYYAYHSNVVSAEDLQSDRQINEPSVLDNQTTAPAANLPEDLQRLNAAMKGLDAPEVANASAAAAKEVTPAEHGPAGHTGELVKHGAAPYNFNDDNKASYYAVLRDDQGQERTVWGVDLERSLAASGAREGDTIKLTRTGTEPVRVPVVEKGEEKVITAQRAEWKTETVSKAVETPAKEGAPTAQEAPTRPEPSAEKATPQPEARTHDVKPAPAVEVAWTEKTNGAPTDYVSRAVAEACAKCDKAIETARGPEKMEAQPMREHQDLAKQDALKEPGVPAREDANSPRSMPEEKATEAKPAADVPQPEKGADPANEYVAKAIAEACAKCDKVIDEARGPGTTTEPAPTKEAEAPEVAKETPSHETGDHSRADGPTHQDNDREAYWEATGKDDDYGRD